MVVNEILSNKYMDGRILIKFTNIYKIFITFENINKIRFYICNRKQRDINSDKIFGYIDIEKDNNIMYILDLYVNPKHRGKGIGSFLFLLVAHYAKNEDIGFIKLDDDSDNSWNIDSNLYVKFGMRYINEYPNPEMVGCVSDIISSILREHE